MPELLPTAKRDAILAELVATEPLTDVVLLSDWRARRIGPRTMRRLLDAEAEIERLRAELGGIRQRANLLGLVGMGGADEEEMDDGGER